MLGFEVAQSTVSKYLMRGRKPPSQSWKTFLRNHADAIAAIDLCVVPTVTFDRLFAFPVAGRKRLTYLPKFVTENRTSRVLRTVIGSRSATQLMSNGSKTASLKPVGKIKGRRIASTFSGIAKRNNRARMLVVLRPRSALSALPFAFFYCLQNVVSTFRIARAISAIASHMDGYPRCGLLQCSLPRALRCRKSGRRPQHH
jgi:hypothetical protein